MRRLGRRDQGSAKPERERIYMRDRARRSALTPISASPAGAAGISPRPGLPLGQWEQDLASPAESAVWKEWPQPQVRTALGLWMVNPPPINSST
jgi:hypothetical protein